MIRLFVIFCTLWSTLYAFQEADEFKIFCYVSSSSNLRSGNGKFDLSDINPKLCTHLVYASVDTDEDGSMQISSDENISLKSFTALRERSAGTKLLVQIGAACGTEQTLINVAKNPNSRLNFVKNVIDFVIQNGFDGLDLHWEIPRREGSSDRVHEDLENHVLLLKELRHHVDQHNLILIGSVIAVESSASLLYDIPQVSKYLDFVALMSYWFYGPFETTITNHNAPLYKAKTEIDGFDQSHNVNSSVNYWLSEGTPKSKLILGTASFGKSFTLKNSIDNIPGSLISGSGEQGPYMKQKGLLSFNEICEFEAENSWAVVWDREQRVPYAFLKDQWVSYDNVKSITEKANYVKDMNLGGVLMYSIDMDDFRGICGERYPLLNALNFVLRTDDFGFCTVK